MRRVVIDEERCKGCALCTTNCPGDLVRMDERINRLGYTPARVRDEDQERCTSCARCARLCPDLAITVLRPPRKG